MGKKKTTRGSSTIIAYLCDVDEATAEALCEDFADAVVDRGLASGDDVHVILAVHPWAEPESLDDLLAETNMLDAALIVIPGDGK